MIRRCLPAFLVLIATFAAVAGPKADYAERIASLIDPKKLATLKSRGAIPRVHKVVYQLEIARREGAHLTLVAAVATKLAKITNSAQANLTCEALVRNHDIARKLGCFDAAGMEDMKHGRSPTIRMGPCTGQELSVDHIIPVSVCPELDNVIVNLELMPLSVNQKKNDRIGQRQRAKAKEFYDAGLLSKRGLKAVMSK